MTRPARLQWTVVLPGPLFSAPVAGPLVLAPDTFELGALDRTTGAPLWRLPAGGEPRSFAWVVVTPRGPVVCAGTERLWRITGLDHAGAKRFSLLLEGWGSEAVALGDSVYVLYTREGAHSGLWELDGDGALRRRWAVPPGSFSLSASGTQISFASKVPESAGLYRVDLADGSLRRSTADAVAWAMCHEDDVLTGRPGGAVSLRDRAGQVRWEHGGGGLSSHLDADGMFGAEHDGGTWAAVCRERSTGALRWRHPLPDAGQYLTVFPWDDLTVLWDAGPLTLVDRRSGAFLQTLEGDFTAVGPSGCGDGILVAAAGETLCCFERA